MLKIYVKTSDLLSRLRSDKDGVVSFEYVIVAAAIITAVGVAFAGAGPNSITGALQAGLGAVSAALVAAV